MFLRLFLAAAVLCAVWPLHLSAAEIGMAISVEGRAVVVRGGRQIALQRRARVETGDVIATGPGATVQLAFNDRTRIVVGPSSQLNLDDVRLAGSQRASRFAVEAVSGTFRFLSGDSEKRSYAIRTPTATMGIRGTIFDFAVRGRSPTSLVTFEGQVRLCGRRGACALVGGGCAVAIALPRRVEVPIDKRARDTLLRTSFPYVVSQERLQPGFRAPVSTCGEIAPLPISVPDSIETRPPSVRAPEVQRAAPPAAPPPPDPEPPEPDPDPPAPDPDPPAPEPPAPEPPAPEPAGFPGQSGARTSPGPSQGIGHVRSAEAGGLGKGHGKEKTTGNGNGNGNGKANGKGRGKGLNR